MNDGNAKQQIVDKIKNSTNILVTVSNNPSVDELSAALGLTLMLNKMNKHATAVFSGAIPPAITFLDPQKTFEDTVNSLRDFIIALDKEKADHLRYKVEGEVVKIFITPYRTTITSDDLEFSQGDYNVELVLALGVKKRDNLDKALEAHGRILHDATVATMSAGQTSELGSIDWHEENASSLSEMLVSLSDSLKSDKPLLDEQIATAYLTGIVAATDRFSNNRTSSKVMTLAAQLMAAGANQQLIAAKLEDANEITGDRNTHTDTATPVSEPGEMDHADGTTDLSEGESTKVERRDAADQEQPKKNDGSLEISHNAVETIDQVAIDTAKQQQEEAARVAEENLAAQLPSVAPVLPPVVDINEQLAKEIETPTPAPAPEFPQIITKPTPQLRGPVANEAWQTADQTPSMGGTLNATAEQAAEDQRKADDVDRNRTILTHTNGDYVSNDDAPTFQAPINAASMPAEEAPLPDMFTPSQAEDSVMQYEESAPPSQRAVTLADIDQQNRQPHEEARDAVNAAFGAVPFTPSDNTQQSNDDQTQNPDPQAPQNAPALPPLPDFSTLPPLPPLSDTPMPNGAIPPEKLEDMFNPAPQQPEQPPQSNDPGQFKIPGQQ